MTARILRLTAALLLTLLAAPPCLALAPDQIVLLANKNVPMSVELAKFYAEQRHIPAGRILELDIPAGANEDEITPADFSRAVVAPLRTFLKDRSLAPNITCLVTFYGAPLRVSGYTNTPEQAKELVAVGAQAKQVLDATLSAIADAERLAAEVMPDFKAGTGSEPQQLTARAEAALGDKSIQRILAITDSTQRSQKLDQWASLVEKLLGPAQAGEFLSRPELGQRVSPEDQKDRRRHALDAQQQLVALRAKADTDPAARAEMRRLIGENFGLLRFAPLLLSQRELLDDAETIASFDSELAMLWWDHYPRRRWQTNLLHYGVMAQAPPTAPPIMMVMRLDGPTPRIVRDLITAAIQTESKGLTGRVVLDGRGMTGNDGYGQYDQTIRRLAELIKSKTKLELTFDDKEPVIQPPRTRDVAVYCGWYSVRNYVPAFIFNPGAVGFHVASFELITLRDPKEKGWVRNLLQAGIDATLGPVAEPYLQSFPPADDYFPLLFTGKLTLAEVYWRTTPMTSWMMCCIGDPLYTPYKANPPLKIEDLPPRLKPALQPVALTGRIPK